MVGKPTLRINAIKLSNSESEALAPKRNINIHSTSEVIETILISACAKAKD